MPGKDRSEYFREYRKKNAEKIAAYQREYRKKHPERAVFSLMNYYIRKAKEYEGQENERD